MRYFVIALGLYAISFVLLAALFIALGTPLSSAAKPLSSQTTEISVQLLGAILAKSAESAFLLAPMLAALCHFADKQIGMLIVGAAAILSVAGFVFRNARRRQAVPAQRQHERRFTESGFSVSMFPASRAPARRVAALRS